MDPQRTGLPWSKLPLSTAGISIYAWTTFHGSGHGSSTHDSTHSIQFMFSRFKTHQLGASHSFLVVHLQLSVENPGADIDGMIAMLNRLDDQSTIPKNQSMINGKRQIYHQLLDDKARCWSASAMLLQTSWLGILVSMASAMGKSACRGAMSQPHGHDPWHDMSPRL